MTLAPAGPVVLFDGVCNLCHASVSYVIDRDPHGRFRFASLQSETARTLLERHGVPIPGSEPDTVLLLEDGRVYAQSTAALRIARRLSGPTRLLSLFLAVPRPVRDLVYRLVARNRYRWFGRSDACRVPTPALKARFLE